MRNNVFDAGRFGAYFKKHMVDNIRLYLMSIVVLTGVLLIFFFFMLSIGNSRSMFRWDEIMPVYLIGMYIAGCIFTSMAFHELGNKAQGTDYLLLPASHLEKFIVTLLITTIGFQLVYNLAFLVASGIGAAILRATTNMIIKNDSADIFDRDLWQYFFYIWFITHAVFLLGATYFHKYGYIKTMFSLCLFVAAMYLVNMLFVDMLFNNALYEKGKALPFGGTMIWVHRTDIGHYPEMLMLSDGTRENIWTVVKFLMAPMIWTLAYFRLKDQEI